MKSIPFVSLTLIFSSGILIANYCILAVSIYIFLLFLSYTLYIASEKLNVFKQFSVLKSYFLASAFFFLGATFLALSLKENSKSSLNSNYLPKDIFVGKILSISKTSGDYLKTEFEINYLIRNSKDTVLIKDKALIFFKDVENQLKLFDVCILNVDLNKIKNKSNPGEFDSEFFWKHKGLEYIAFANEMNYFKIGKSKPSFLHFFHELRNYFSSVLDKFLKGNELGVAKALILGDRSSLDSEITGKFGNTGAMHVLAVSGLHVGILLQIITLLLGLFKRWISKKNAILFSLILIWIYAFMTGLSPSVVRSVIMFSLLVGSQLLERDYNNFNVLAFSALIILIWNPHFLFDIGFQLSYLAMLSIFMFYKPLSKLIYIKNKILKTVYEGTMVGVAAQILTVPLTLYYFHQFPNYFIITNIGLMLFSFLILVFGLSLFSFNFITFLAKPIAWLLSISLFFMLFIIDKLPGAVSMGFELNSMFVFLLFLAIFVFYYALKNLKYKTLIVVLICSITLTSFIVEKRFSNISKNEICFLQANEVNFIVKVANKNIVLYGNKNKDSKKAMFLAKSYQKINPGEIQLIEISNSKKTAINIGKNTLKIERLKGGYEIQVNSKSFFFVTSLTFSSPIQTKIFASWLSVNDEKYLLKDNSFRFPIN